ncbi:O-antigen ligase family protein [Fodinibius saliphilus]|uniref:O-antigen ligase family protein n=1 Tax=Fodinibius saliphilus TaxID=1920650 RepID=UPI00110A0462|nr:O-antigen ligase family protein [Fodinibius saliphilus]
MKENKARLYLIFTYILILAGSVVDLGTGYFTEFLNYSALTPGVLFRGGVVLPVFLLWCLKSKSSSLIPLYLGMLCVLSAVFLGLSAGLQTSLISKISGLLKVVYPYLGLGGLIYIHKYKRYFHTNEIWTLGYYYGVIVIIGIIFFTYVGLGIQSYSHQLYTSSGLYGAANDTGLILLIAFCFFLYYNISFQSFKVSKLIVISLLFLFSAFLINTKALFIGIPVSFIVIMGYSIFAKEVKSASFKAGIFLITALFIGAVWYIVQYLQDLGLTYTLSRITELASGNFGFRNYAFGIEQIQNFSLTEHLFGSQRNFLIIESDLIDIYGKFGMLFCLTAFGIPLFFLWKIFKHFLIKRSLQDLVLVIGLSFYLLHGVIAGHALVSAQVNNIIILVYFLIWLRLKR